MTLTSVTAAIGRLARRDNRAEADIQSDVRIVLLDGELDLGDADVDTDGQAIVGLESPLQDGSQRRIDVEVGHGVVECKRDLRKAGVLPLAERQLEGYLHVREMQTGARWTGILTDGTTWRLYRLEGEVIAHVTSLEISPSEPNAGELLGWLESVLATRQRVTPTPAAIESKLGSKSPSYLVDYARLADLLEAARGDSRVRLKRELWAKMLRAAFGAEFDDDDSLFLRHTLLVLSAESIAHAVLGFDLRAGQVPPEDLVTGKAFTRAKILNVVEEDFFDWIAEVDGGLAFVADLTRRIGRFDWSDVQHDVLKVLYESIIDQSDREGLGEYYTPDWLAERMVDHAFGDPLHQRVLDPGCGSGTFLFHAVRKYVSAAEGSGISPGKAAMNATSHVYGLDIHPVSVTLARVTYLLALGTERINHDDRSVLPVPVFLGDSLQWERHRDLFTDDEGIRVATGGQELMAGGGGGLFDQELIFPISMWSDAERFDRVVSDMARAIPKAVTLAAANPIWKRYGIVGIDQQVLTETFEKWWGLFRSGRDSIWGFYTRNLVRPAWLAQSKNGVDVLIGNPPWLRYSKMTASMQKRYKDLCRARGLLTGGLGASARDLAPLFVVRAIELYLRSGGRFAFVMPHPVLTRKPHTGFRSGDWRGDESGELCVAFEQPWDMSGAPTGFPMTSCVIHGVHSPGHPKRMPGIATKWLAKFRQTRSRWTDVADRFSYEEERLGVLNAGEIVPASPYDSKFRQGAILVPRMALLVEKSPSGPLSVGKGRAEIRSLRSNLEDPKFKKLEPLSGVVEEQFLRGMFLGAKVAPFRALQPALTVLPLTADDIMTAEEIRQYPDMADWWFDGAESRWEQGREPHEKAPLLERMDYFQQLSSQLPIPQHRVVYAASGTTLAAARLDDGTSVIEHSVYWGPVSGVDEGRYLVGILNSDTLLGRIEQYQAAGLFGKRHFDKLLLRVPFGGYNATDPQHRTIVKLASRAEEVASNVLVDGTTGFRRIRRDIRAALIADGVQGALENAVAAVLPAVDD